MDNRDLEYTFMDIQRYSGGITHLLMASMQLQMKLLVFLYRMARKGLVSLKFATNYEKFLERSGGEHTIYNIPLSSRSAEKLKDNIDKITDLEAELENTKNPAHKTQIRKEIEKIKEDMPEIKQLQELNIDHCVLPKLNGLDNTMRWK